MHPTVKFESELVRKYGVTGPRYTSYPTAASFHGGFDDIAYRMHVAQSNEELIPRPLSLYLHLPFCESLCYYCACNKKVTRHRDQAAYYLRVLEREIALQAPLFDADREVIQLHLGGGTPTYFDDAQLERLIGSLSRHFSFQQPGRGEFSIEVDPRTVDPGRLDVLRELGFGRISLGVQDFDPTVQQAVNRVQDRDATLGLVRRAREAGFDSVSLDLIYGLPLQTPESFAATIGSVLEVRPERLAVYNYAHLPDQFRAQRLIRAEDLPPPEVKLALLQHTIERLTRAGYVYIGMDHFALPEDALAQARKDGTLQRNFQGYSTLRECDMVGLGVSAIGRIGPCFAQNHRDIPSWRARVEAGALPIWRGISLDWEDLLRQEVISTVMCTGEVRYEHYARAWHIDFEDHFAPELHHLQQLEDDGLLHLGAAGFEATPAGLLLLRAIAMVFDEYRPGAGQETHFSRLI